MAWPPETASYYSWEEVPISSDKGRREVHYYLKRRDGGADLAVVGKEKSSRHMSYKYALKNSRSVLYKLKSRRDVIDWLNSIVSDTLPQQSNIPIGGSLIPKAAGKLDLETLKKTQLQGLVHCTKNFLWMGSPWTGRRGRKHYLSFCRNGVRVSVNDFVYVLAEENKRLIAYLEDMYEDSRGNKMVVVRWFHKIDEVGIILPHNVNDREIFFSLCLQDINIECIDGLATVLSPQHYEKFLKEPTYFQLDAFFCRKIFENDDVEPFDITQLRGYWKQELLRYMYNVPITKHDASTQQPDADQRTGGTVGCFCVEIRQEKRRRLSKDDCSFSHSVPTEILDTPSNQNFDSKSDPDGFDQKFDSESDPDGLSLGASAVTTFKKEAKHSSPPYIKKGSLVEVLSQDSGIRGCWFRALIMKKHKDKVKVQYLDIQDAEDGAYKLEEWILASRVAAPDHLGLRITGRTIVRPPSEPRKGKVQWTFDVGTIVDVWWHDAWWEGIIVQKEAGKFRVYLPGEKQMSFFHHGDLRQSLEWMASEWIHIKPRPDLVNSLLSSMEMKQVEVKFRDNNAAEVTVSHDGQSRNNDSGCISFCPDSTTNKETVLQPVPDLLKDVLLSKLKWKTSKKRRRGSGCSVRKPYLDNSIKSTPVARTSKTCERSLVPGSLQVDCENCKYMRDPVFGSSVVPPLTSLVMSR